MPTPKKPAKLREPCPCGCGRFSRGRSKYFEEACRSRFWRGKHLDSYREFLRKKKYNSERRVERAKRERAAWDAWILIYANQRLIVEQKQILDMHNKNYSAWLILELIRADGVTLPNAFEPYLRKYLKGE
jgi:hypothetical protein